MALKALRYDMMSLIATFCRHPRWYKTQYVNHLITIPHIPIQRRIFTSQPYRVLADVIAYPRVVIAELHTFPIIKITTLTKAGLLTLF